MTDDAGQTWRQVLLANTWIHDVALSNDGARVFVATYEGLTAVMTDSFETANVSPTPMTCLGMTSDTLWACGASAAAFGLGRSANGGTDSSLACGGETCRDPCKCPDGSDIAERCGAEWPFQPSTSSSASWKRPVQEVDITKRTRRGIGTFLALALI